MIGFAFECNTMVMIDLQKYFAFFVCYISICDGCSIAFYQVDCRWTFRDLMGDLPRSGGQ